MQAWGPGADNSTIAIPAPPTNGTGAGDKTVALASTYATASYEADVTVSAPVGGSTHHLKVTASDTAITVDLDQQRVINVNDATNALPAVFQSGSFGLRRFGVGAGFSNITIRTYPTVKSPSYDFSKVVGAVYTPSNAVNAIDFPENYDPEIVNRELTYAQTYGLNTIAVYLHYLVWANDRVAFLSKFENLLKIAARLASRSHRSSTTTAGTPRRNTARSRRRFGACTTASGCSRPARRWNRRISSRRRPIPLSRIRPVWRATSPTSSRRIATTRASSSGKR